MDLSRVAMVIGQEKLPVLARARVAVVGLGGVGSYVAEALCRSGVGHLLLIDADVVAASQYQSAIAGAHQHRGQTEDRDR